MRWFGQRPRIEPIGEPSALVLFADTNFFIQCDTPDSLDWSLIANFDTVHVVVTRPVANEIDNQKNRGGDRLGNKARRTASLFRSIVQSNSNVLVANEAQPRVLLSIRSDIRLPRRPDELLDMNEKDDQLVAIADRYRRSHPEQTVKLLTLDSGPMVSAQAVGLDVAVVPDDWILPPESDTKERELNRLKDEVIRLRKAEPSFEIWITGLDSDEPVDLVEMTLTHYTALSDAEHASVLKALEDAFPIATDFGPESKDPKKSFMNLGQVWEPASIEDIDRYKGAYAQWLTACGEFFKGFHARLNQATSPPGAIVVAKNIGSRPAKDALIEIEAYGAFQLRVPYDSDDDDDESHPPSLPPSPTPPNGKWISAMFSADEIIRRFAIEDPLKSLSKISSNLYSPPIMPPGLTGPTTRDPNGFYYKSNRPIFGTSVVLLECAQWRHSIGSHDFYVEFVIPPDTNSVQGAINTRIHAENLTDVASRTVPVKISRTMNSCLEEAHQCIERLGSM